MKKVMANILTLATAGAAFAHEGGHIHPHGSETLIVVGTILVVGAGMFWRSK